MYRGNTIVIALKKCIRHRYSLQILETPIRASAFLPIFFNIRNSLCALHVLVKFSIEDCMLDQTYKKTSLRILCYYETMQFSCFKMYSIEQNVNILFSLFFLTLNNFIPKMSISQVLRRLFARTVSTRLAPPEYDIWL